MKRVLVTGGAGFIGSSIVSLLLERDYKVGILDNFSTGSTGNIPRHPNLTVHTGDITRYDHCARHMKLYDAVIHQAALVGVPESMKNPLQTNLVNITGTVNLLIAAVEANIAKFVYASSAAVYGDSTRILREDLPTKPLSPYAASKLAAEIYCSMFTKAYNLDTISLRYFNVYGPHQNKLYSGVVPTFLSQARQGLPLTIYGDGTVTRDFVYVSDVAEANLLALESDLHNEVFNIGTGVPCSLRFLADSVLQIINPNLEIIRGPMRTGDIKFSVADITKAKTVLQYQPKVPLGSGLLLTMKDRK